MTLTSGMLVWPQLISERLVFLTWLLVLFMRAPPLVLLLTRVCLTGIWNIALLLSLILRQLPLPAGPLHRETRQLCGTLGQKQPPWVNRSYLVTL